MWDAARESRRSANNASGTGVAVRFFSNDDGDDEDEDEDEERW